MNFFARFSLLAILLLIAGRALAADALPTFEQQQYPGANKVNEMTLGEMSSRQYETTDDLAKVTEFYKPRFPKQQVISGDGAYFADIKEDGSGFSVTLSKGGDGKTMIMLLRQEKKIAP